MRLSVNVLKLFSVMLFWKSVFAEASETRRPEPGQAAAASILMPVVATKAAAPVAIEAIQ